MTDNDTNGQERIDYTDKATLQRLYYEEQLSANDIADLADVTGGTIRNWMDKHGLERRDNGEAAAIKNRVEYAQYTVDKDGYTVWKSWTGEKVTRLPIHHLLLIAEGADPHGVFADGTEGHHDIPIPWLNTPENIELLSVHDHRSHHSSGEAHNLAKLSRADVRDIRRRLSTGDTSADVAEDYEVSPSAIRYAARGDNWGHID